MGSSEKQKKKEAGATPLTQEQVAERFAARYGLAVKGMQNSVDADAAVLRSMIVSALNKAKPDKKEDAEAAIDKAVEEFCSSKPNSLLAKYIRSGGNVVENWGFDNGRGSAVIASGDVKKAISDYAAKFRSDIFTDANVYDAQVPRPAGARQVSYQSTLILEGFGGDVGRGLVAALPPLMTRSLRIGESDPSAKDPIPNVGIAVGTFSAQPGKRSMNDGKPCINVTSGG